MSTTTLAPTAADRRAPATARPLMSRSKTRPLVTPEKRCHSDSSTPRAPAPTADRGRQHLPADRSRPQDVADIAARGGRTRAAPLDAAGRAPAAHRPATWLLANPHALRGLLRGRRYGHRGW